MSQASKGVVRWGPECETVLLHVARIMAGLVAVKDFNVPHWNEHLDPYLEVSVYTHRYILPWLVCVTVRHGRVAVCHRASCDLLPFISGKARAVRNVRGCLQRALPLRDTEALLHERVL